MPDKTAAAVELTVLSRMAGRDFDDAVKQIREWHLNWIDLAGKIYGEPADTLNQHTAERAVATLQAAGLRAYCLSSNIFDDTVEIGKDAFREKHLSTLAKTLAGAQIIRPRRVRLIAGKFSAVSHGGGNVALLKRDYPWVAEVYREAIDRILDAGFLPTIENEADNCFLATPQEFIEFFDWLGSPVQRIATWDIQNAWNMGSFPTIEGYKAIRDIVGYVHTKGGQAEPGSSDLKWNVGLEDASWPVAQIIQAVVDDAITPVICLNPSHGAMKPGYNYGQSGPPGQAAPSRNRDLAPMTKRDLDYLRSTVKGIRQ
jgi:sugar phosphate isomerase/epimerase